MYDPPTSTAPLPVVKPLWNPGLVRTLWFVAAMYSSIGGATELHGPTRRLLGGGFVCDYLSSIHPNVQSKPETEEELFCKH